MIAGCFPGNCACLKPTGTPSMLNGRAQLMTRYLMSINGHQQHARSLVRCLSQLWRDRAPQTRSSGVGGSPQGKFVRRVTSSKVFCGAICRTLVVQLAEALMSVCSCRRVRSHRCVMTSSQARRHHTSCSLHVHRHFCDFPTN